MPEPEPEPEQPTPLSDEVIGATIDHHLRQCGLAPLATGIDLETGTGVIWCGSCGEALLEFQLRPGDESDRMWG